MFEIKEQDNIGIETLTDSVLGGHHLLISVPSKSPPAKTFTPVSEQPLTTRSNLRRLVPRVVRKTTIE